MRAPWVVLEIWKNKAVTAISCDNRDIAVEKFCEMVSDFGVEPYEELINSNIFCGEDDCVVQMLELK
jgi:hypothetical protein